MLYLTFFAFLFLTLSFLSLWIKKDTFIWGTFLFLSIFSGIAAGHISWIGLGFIMFLALLWFYYDQNPDFLIFLAIVSLSMCFKLRFLPGYFPHFFTEKFAIGLENPLIGLFPLALLVPLARSLKDWQDVAKGLLFGCSGIALIALLATISSVVHWNLKIPPFMLERTLSNFILTSIPEEGFYRGFVQTKLGDYFRNTLWGKIGALLLTSLLFAAAHVFWSPNIGMLAFTFLASLLYGGVYWFSGKIESAILCHFLLNIIHMVFFSYHSV